MDWVNCCGRHSCGGQATGTRFLTAGQVNRFMGAPTKHEVSNEAGVPSSGGRYGAVLHLSEALSQCHDPEDLTSVLSEQLRGCLEFDRFYIVVYKEDSEEIEWAVIGREKSLIAMYANSPVQQRPSWQVYRTQEPIYIRDWKTDESFPPALRKGIADLGLDLGPLVFVPLTTPHRRLGALGMSGSPGTVYSEDDIDFLRLIGRIVAFAIDDSFNLRQVEAARAELQHQNDRLQRSERELREVIEKIPSMAWSATADGSAEFFNPRWLEYAGLTAAQARGTGWTAAIHPEDLSGLLEHWRGLLATETPGEYEGRMRRFDGEYRWCLFRITPAFDENRKLVKWYGTNSDIEDRKRAETLLSGANRILEMVAKGSPLADTLDALCRLVEEHTGSLASILLLEGNRLRHGAAPNLPREYTKAIDGAPIGPRAGSCGTAAHRAEQVIVEDILTDPLWADYRGLALPHSLRACWSTPVFSSQGRVIATFAMYYREPRRPDYSHRRVIEQVAQLAGVAVEREMMQKTLRSSEAYLAEAQRLTQTGSFAIDGASRQTVYWSEEMFRLFGFDPQKGPPIWDQWVQRVHPEDQDRLRLSGEKTFREKVDCDVEFRIMNPDGRIKHIHGIGHPILGSDGGLVQVVGTMVDITERRRAEEALRRSEGYLEQAQRIAHIGSWVWQPLERRALYLSAEWYRIYEFDPKDGIPTWEQRLARVHPEDRARWKAAIDRAIAEKSDYEIGFRILPPHSPVKYVHTLGHRILGPSGDLVQFVGISMDVTETRQVEQERERLRQELTHLSHLNRVSTLGELTASLAHEINQPIGAAVTNAEACLRFLNRDRPDLTEAREAALEMVRDARRAGDIIDRVRSLYRKGSAQLEMVDINELVREMIDMLRDEANRHSVTMRTDLDEELTPVLADRVQLQQVLMNLTLNGIEAMRDKAGELRIKSQMTEDRKLLVSIADTGVGLPIGRSDQIFDAFFTTKPQGTGLGLAITRSIIESHGGRVWAAANTGPGTTFQFTLPQRRALRE
jgi:PAS domain S-box-containing protein